MLVFALTPSGQANDEADSERLRAEFEANAEEGWKAHRLRHAISRAEHIRRSLTSVSSRAEAPISRNVDIMVYARGDFRVNLGDTSINQSVIGSNSQYAFMVSREPESNWTLVNVEMLEEGGLDFRPDDIKPGSGNMRSALEMVRRKFFDDDRLHVIGIPIAIFANQEGVFESFSELADEQMGRIVKVRVNHSRRGVRSGTIGVSGTVDFLADHDWIMYGFDLKYQYFDDDEILEKELDHVLETTYEGASPPRLVRLFKKSTKNGQPISTQTDEIRELNYRERREMQSKCYLTGFGLPEPEGVSWGWPLWYYIVGGISLMAVGIVGVYLVRRRR